MADAKLKPGDLVKLDDKIDLGDEWGYGIFCRLKTPAEITSHANCPELRLQARVFWLAPKNINDRGFKGINPIKWLVKVS